MDPQHNSAAPPRGRAKRTFTEIRKKVHFEVPEGHLADDEADQRSDLSRKLTRRQRLRNFLCSLSTLVTLIFLILLCMVATATTTTTRVATAKALYATWSASHATHINILQSHLENVAGVTFRRGVAAASLFATALRPIESNRTLTMLCAQLAMGDANFRVRTLSLVSSEASQFLSCSHGDRTQRSLSNLTSLMSDNGHFNGFYHVNPVTYTYDDPPVLRYPVPSNITTDILIHEYAKFIPTIDKARAYLNGTLSTLTLVDFWSQPFLQPNRIYFTMPLFATGRSIISNPNVRLSDFAMTRIDGDTLFNASLLSNPGVHTRMMVLINQSLGTNNPLVLSNNWNQQVVFDPLYLLLIETMTSYLSVNQITDPLMRQAVKHVDLKALQTPGYYHTTRLTYQGATAIVTAWVYTTKTGLSLPIVMVSPHNAIIGRYLTICDVCSAVTALVILLITALFYFAIDRYLSRPLREVTAAMEASVERGVRQPVRGAACDVVQLVETRELACAYNAAMAQLRVVDAFVPDAVRATRRGGPSLREHYLTVVTVRVRAGSGAGGAGGAAYGGDVGVDTSALLRRHPGAGAGAGAGGGGVSGDRGRRGGGGLAALVNAVAEAATALTNSGPFASAASLSAFVAAVRELCEARGGTVHRAAPDECVLHFAANVRRVLSGSGAGSVGGAGAGAATGDRSLAAAVERAADADARAGVECALCVSRWVEQQQHQQQRGNGNSDSSSNCVDAVPDVRVVVDSGVFVCGEYRAPGSEQTLCVALGRDVAGAVGHVPAAIGVRVAATGEAALRVRGGAGGSAGGGTAAAAAAAACSSPPPFPAAAAERGGFRVLPVEALRTGRAGLDGGAVTLYEVLPGAVDGDAAWLAYARCCDDGFECMVRGDYAGALRAYRGVGEVGDLEPGLLPRCLSREAAHSDAVGGAVSVQVARLLRECERRVRAGSTAGYERRRHVPLGADAVLGVEARSPVSASVAVALSPTNICSRTPTAASRLRSLRAAKKRVAMRATASLPRHIVSLNTPEGLERRVIGVMPKPIRDTDGLEWYTPLACEGSDWRSLWKRPFTALGSAGTLSTVTVVLMREGSGMFRKVMDAAPDGPMSDYLRSALPVWSPSRSLRENALLFFEMHLSDSHPTLLKPLCYSFDVEGCVVVFWEFCPAGTLRDVVTRYFSLSRMTVVRFSFSIVSGLAYLHANGLVHGRLCLDWVAVGADGVCRLLNHCTDYDLEMECALVPLSCYVSPQMAAGQRPTPECDMFCYGLMILELVTREPAWRWATVPDGAAPHGTQEELVALMAEGGLTFSAAVVDGRVVPNVEKMETPFIRRRHTDTGRAMVRRLVSYDPAERLTANELLAATSKVLAEHGISVDVKT